MLAYEYQSGKTDRSETADRFSVERPGKTIGIPKEKSLEKHRETIGTPQGNYRKSPSKSTGNNRKSI